VIRDRLYFAYGSNVDPNRFSQRCPGHREIGPAHLTHWRVAFAGRSRLWGGGVGTLRPEPKGSVPGILYRLKPVHWRTLDRIEGHPGFYKRVQITVDSRTVWTYLLDPELPENAPTAQYLQAVVDARSARGWDPADWMAANKHANLHNHARK
jgi:gamma-glutamylcyclotransferase (GGCT)/AIG2-like uncharacterized protein YtfP